MRTRATVLSFAAVGALGGFAASIVFGLALDIVIGPPTMLLCALLGYIVSRVKHGWALTIPLVPLAGMVNGAVIAMIIEPRHVWEAAQFGAWVSVPFLFVLPFVAWMASRASEARPGSLARRFERTRLVSTTVVAGAVLLGIPLSMRSTGVFTTQFGPSGMVLGLVGMLTTVALVGVVRTLAGVLRTNEARRVVPLLRSSEPEGAGDLRDPQYLDLGLGTTHHVYLDPQTMLRGMPVARVMYQGDVHRVARLGTIALGFATAALFATITNVVQTLLRLS